ncbi:MAG: endolytic transglycosylase MltG [Streptosporangiales bacterium]|nr:endolytic transglycosylase MltG [Streptosporangiales bacterium]
MSEIDLGWSDEPRRHRGGRHHHAAKRQRHVRRRRRRRRVFGPLLTVILLFGVFGVMGFGGYRLLRTFVAPPDYAGQGSGSVVVRVQPGDTVTEIGDTLHRAGVVRSTNAFVRAAESNPRASSVQPGSYRLRREMQASQALTLLLDPSSRIRLKVTIPEGLRVVQILQRVSKRTGIPLSELKREAENPEGLGLPDYADSRVEGYLFPATYTIEPGTPADEVLRMMVERFHQEAKDVGLERRARQVNLTPKEAMTVASLVQAEGGRHSDFPKISRVVYNRLAVNRKLELDSTVLYAQNKYGIIASDRDLRSTSAYNTYRHTGLPPGPIGSPGRQAMEAALKPAKGDWFFFVTTDPENNVTKFTDNVGQFQRFREELRANMGQG